MSSMTVVLLVGVFRWEETIGCWLRRFATEVEAGLNLAARRYVRNTFQLFGNM